MDSSETLSDETRQTLYFAHMAIIGTALTLPDLCRAVLSDEIDEGETAKAWLVLGTFLRMPAVLELHNRNSRFVEARIRYSPQSPVCRVGEHVGPCAHTAAARFIGEIARRFVDSLDVDPELDHFDHAAMGELSTQIAEVLPDVLAPASEIDWAELTGELEIEAALALGDYRPSTAELAEEAAARGASALKRYRPPDCEHCGATLRVNRTQSNPSGSTTRYLFCRACGRTTKAATFHENSME